LIVFVSRLDDAEQIVRFAMGLAVKYSSVATPALPAPPDAPWGGFGS
jgi:hypothetical protein